MTVQTRTAHLSTLTFPAPGVGSIAINDPVTFDLTIPVGSPWTSGRHWHDDHAEYWKVLSGALLVTINNDSFVVTGGSPMVSIPPKARHELMRWDCPGRTDHEKAAQEAFRKEMIAKGQTEELEKLGAQDLKAEESTTPADGQKELFFRNLLSAFSEPRTGILGEVLRFIQILIIYQGLDARMVIVDMRPESGNGWRAMVEETIWWLLNLGARGAHTETIPRSHYYTTTLRLVIIKLEQVHAHIQAASSDGTVMQTVLSRTAQVRCICNCPSCLSTTYAATRRATTATARRIIRVGDVFTASLSSLAAGLAFADSKKKDDRRKQWDKVIAEARATVDATEIQQENRLAALSDDAGVKASRRTRAIERHVSAERAIKGVEAWDAQESEEQDQPAPISDGRTDNWLDVFDWAQEQHKMREASGFQDWKGPPLSLLQSLSKNQLKDLLCNMRLLRRFYGGPDCENLVNEQSNYPLSMKKIKTLEWSVARMVLKLLMHCSKDFLQPSESPLCPTSSLLRELLEEETIQTKLAYTRERLKILHTECRPPIYYQEFESPPIPNYDDITREEEYEQSAGLNLSLRKLLESMKHEMDLSDLMSKICYNLLTARTPPDIHTYNMLLVRFCALGKEDLVNAVLYSMRESHIRPNEITHATLLRHFTATENGVGFCHYWKRMDGYLGGLALANPEYSILPVVKERYHIFGRNHHKAAEKARMNGEVYESLIVGAVKFLGDQFAMHYYRNMISEGWKPSLGIALAILQDCCNRSDWTVGRAVLEQIEKTAEKINTLTYEWMLRLCQCCGQQDIFNQILLNGVLCGALPASLLDLPDHAKTEDVAFLIECAKVLQEPRKAIGKLKELKRKAHHTSQRLGDGNTFLLENVFHGCEDEEKRCHTVSRTNDDWKARLALQSRLHDICNNIRDTVLQVNRTLYASKNLSSVKFWLSRRVKQLERELEQQANGVAHLPYSNAVKHEKSQRIEAKRAEDGEGDSDKSLDFPLIASVSGNDSEYVFDQHLETLLPPPGPMESASA